MYARITFSRKTFIMRIPGMAVLLALIASFCLPSVARIQQPGERPCEPVAYFRQANDYYRKGQYEQALILYKKLDHLGYSSGSLYYNLGNTYFKLGKKGLAILYYEKARRLIPQDDDLKTNLAIALTGVDEGNTGWFTEVYQSLLFLAPLDTLAMIASITFFIFMTVLCLTFLFPCLLKNSSGRVHRLWWSLLLVTGLLCMFYFTVTVLAYYDQCQNQAVVIKSGAKAYFEPIRQARFISALMRDPAFTF